MEKIDYDRMEIKQVKKAQKEENERKQAAPQNEFQNKDLFWQMNLPLNQYLVLFQKYGNCH